MTEPKEKQLTLKQEKFCREYILCMNASEAYRRAYDAENMKPETIWKRASELMSDGAVKGRIEQLKNDVETALGINKIKMVETLQEIIGRSLEGKAKMKWDPEEKRMVYETNEDGQIVYEYDSAGANSAVDKIMKAMGYYAPSQSQQLGKDGKPVDPQAQPIKIEIIKNYGQDANQSNSETDVNVGSAN